MHPILLPLIYLPQLPTLQAPLKSCPAPIHFSSMKRKAEKNPKKPTARKVKPHRILLPSMNKPWQAGSDFNLHVSQGGSKPVPPEVEGCFN